MGLFGIWILDLRAKLPHFMPDGSSPRVHVTFNPNIHLALSTPMSPECSLSFRYQYRSVMNVSPSPCSLNHVFQSPSSGVEVSGKEYGLRNSRFALVPFPLNLYVPVAIYVLSHCCIKSGKLTEPSEWSCVRTPAPLLAPPGTVCQQIHDPPGGAVSPPAAAVPLPGSCPGSVLLLRASP